jgi:two-component system chemotaxis response regulator CheB
VTKVLVVDDSALVRRLLGHALSSEPEFEVVFARDGIEALDMLKRERPDVVTLDIQMPQMDGLTCLDRIMIERPTPVVMVSSLAVEGAEATLEALRLGAVDFLLKPDGAVSLKMDVFAPQVVAKVRAAAGVRLRATKRLRERIAYNIGAAQSTSTVRRAPAARAGQETGIVLIGTSTGGPPALETVLSSLPADFPWPLVIAQHMPASFTASLAARLDRFCNLSVVEVAHAVRLQPGNAYIGRGDGDVVIRRQGGALAALPAAAQDYPWHPSTDRLVKSALMQLSAERLIGVLMTGMGDDGAEAMTRLHALGGITIAQSEDTAVVWGMPGALAKANGADWILPVDAIATKLQELVAAHATDPKDA